MSPETRNGPATPQQRPVPAISNHQPTRQANPSDLWQVWAVAYAPAGRRHRWLLIVQNCPACNGAHGHYGGTDGAIKRAGCGRTSYYVRTRPALGAVA